MSDYQPVSCALHSELELYILKGEEIALRWRGKDGEPVRARVRPVDLFTREGEEYLLIELASGQHQEIRLDYAELVQ